jgi:hypothetical protein
MPAPARRSFSPCDRVSHVKIATPDRAWEETSTGCVISWRATWPPSSTVEEARCPAVTGQLHDIPFWHLLLERVAWSHTAPRLQSLPPTKSDSQTARFSGPFLLQGDSLSPEGARLRPSRQGTHLLPSLRYDSERKPLCLPGPGSRRDRPWPSRRLHDG